MSTFKIGLLGAGGKLKVENGFLSYQHPYARSFRVRIADIQTVTIDTGSWGSGFLKVIGNGTVLAEEKMPVPWAEKCQTWILEQLEAAKADGK